MGKLVVELEINQIGSIVEITAFVVDGNPVSPLQFKFCINGEVVALTNKLCIPVGQLTEDIRVVVTDACGNKGRAKVRPTSNGQ